MARVPSEFRLVLEAHSLSLKELAPLKWPHLLHTVIAGRVAKSGEGRATLSSSGLAGISKRRIPKNLQVQPKILYVWRQGRGDAG